MTIDGVASPTLAGISMMSGNDPNMFNNPHNDIGHQLMHMELLSYGLKHSEKAKLLAQELKDGLNVPPLKVQKIIMVHLLLSFIISTCYKIFMQ